MYKERKILTPPQNITLSFIFQLLHWDWVYECIMYIVTIHSAHVYTILLFLTK